MIIEKTLFVPTTFRVRKVHFRKKGRDNASNWSKISAFEKGNFEEKRPRKRRSETPIFVVFLVSEVTDMKMTSRKSKTRNFELREF